MNLSVLYGFLGALGLFVACWFVFVAPSERRYHERKLAIVQKRLAEREGARANEAGGGHILDTERLALREMTVDDAAFMLALLNDEDFLKYIGDRGVRSEPQARDYLQRGPIDSYRRHGYGMYIAERRNGDAAVGICGLVRREGLDAPDVGFAILPAFRGKGYATEATHAMLRHALTAMGLRRVLAIATPDNAASNRILGQAGMKPAGTVRLPGSGTDLNLYVYEA